MNGMCYHRGKFGEVQGQCFSPDELAHTAIAPKMQWLTKKWFISSRDNGQRGLFGDSAPCHPLSGIQADRAEQLPCGTLAVAVQRERSNGTGTAS